MTDRRAPRRRRGRPVSVAVVLALMAGGVGCAAPSDQIVVAAAAALRPVLTEIAEGFRAAHPGVTVRLDFGPSPELATQLLNGAAADVFASADSAQMDKVADAGLLAGAPIRFATSTLVIITAPGNPEHVTTLADLTGLRVVVSPPPMPCGVATRRVTELAGVHLTPISEEPDAEDVLNKVATGEADAGLVYASDAVAAGDKISTVTFPQAAAAVSANLIAVLSASAQPTLAAALVEAVTGPAGRDALDRAGFGAA